jgi:hypothetical protein
VWQRIEKILARMYSACKAVASTLSDKFVAAKTSLLVFKHNEIILCIASKYCSDRLSSARDETSLFYGRKHYQVARYFADRGACCIIHSGEYNFFDSLSFLQRTFLYFWSRRSGCVIRLNLIFTPASLNNNLKCWSEINVIKHPRFMKNKIRLCCSILALNELYGFDARYLCGQSWCADDFAIKTNVYNTFVRSLDCVDRSVQSKLIFVKSLLTVFEKTNHVLSLILSSKEDVEYYLREDYSIYAPSRDGESISSWKCFFNLAALAVLIVVFVLAVINVRYALSMQHKLKVFLESPDVSAAVKLNNALAYDYRDALFPARKAYDQHSISVVRLKLADEISARASDDLMFLSDHTPAALIVRSSAMNENYLTKYFNLFFLQYHGGAENVILNSIFSIEPLTENSYSYFANILSSSFMSDVNMGLRSAHMKMIALPPRKLVATVINFYVSKFLDITKDKDRVDFYDAVLQLLSSSKFWHELGVYSGEAHAADDFSNKLQSSLYSSAADYKLLFNWESQADTRSSLRLMCHITGMQLDLHRYNMLLTKLRSLQSSSNSKKVSEIQLMLAGSKKSLFYRFNSSINDSVPSSSPPLVRAWLELPLHAVLLKSLNAYVNYLQASWSSLLDGSSTPKIPAFITYDGVFNLSRVQEFFASNSKSGIWLTHNILPLLHLDSDGLVSNTYYGLKFRFSHLFLTNITMWQRFIKPVILNSKKVWNGSWRPLPSSKIASWHANINGVKIAYANGPTSWSDFVLPNSQLQSFNIYYSALSGKRHYIHYSGEKYFFWSFIAKNAHYSNKLSAFVLRLSSDHNHSSPEFLLRSDHDKFWLSFLNHGFSFVRILQG